MALDLSSQMEKGDKYIGYMYHNPCSLFSKKRKRSSYITYIHNTSSTVVYWVDQEKDNFIE
jgi:hypothetical protein